MATLKEIKGHIKSINDTKKITNAMYLISSSKLKAAKSTLSDSPEYFRVLEIETKAVLSGASESECVYSADKEGKTGILVITSDKGLCGDYNKSVIRKADELTASGDCIIYPVGEKARNYFNGSLKETDNNFCFSIKSASSETAAEIAEYMCNEFFSGKISKVIAVYSEMINSIQSVVTVKDILPIKAENTVTESSYEFVPSRKDVLDELIPLYISGMFYSIILSSFISEQNSRMMAMDAANTNAKSMLDSLTLQYNHMRQNAITQEITEISSGRK